MSRLSNHNAPVSVPQRDWETKSAALASWKMLDRHLSPRLEQQLWHPGRLVQGTCVLEHQRSGHHVLCKCADCWAPMQCFPPSRSVSHWLRECKGGAEERTGGLPVYHGCRRGQCPTPCAPGGPLGAYKLLKLPGKMESVQSCPQPSELGQGWGKACWAISEQGFDSYCMRSCLLSPRRSRSPFSAVVCQLWYLAPLFLHCSLCTLMMNPGLNNWLFCALTPSGAAQSMDGSYCSWEAEGHPQHAGSWCSFVWRKGPLLPQSPNGFLVLILVQFSQGPQCQYVRPWVWRSLATGI